MRRYRRWNIKFSARHSGRLLKPDVQMYKKNKTWLISNVAPIDTKAIAELYKNYYSLFKRRCHMSKLKWVRVCLGKGDFLQVQLNYFWKMPNPAQRISSSFTLVFKISQLLKIVKDTKREKLQKHILTSSNLGTFFAENVLGKHILPLHTRAVMDYSRLHAQSKL